MRHNFGIRRDDAALDRVIIAAQLQPLMSNAKWVKLIAMLTQNWQLLHECKVKLIWEDASVERRLLIDENTSYNFDYYANAMEAMIYGSPHLGWSAYKEIEWLDFPSFSSDKAVAQDIVIIQQKIEEVGQFQLDLSTDNLRLYAYQRHKNESFNFD